MKCAKLLTAKFEALLVDVEHDDLRSRFNRELHHGQPDRAGTDHQRKLARFNPRPVYGVTSDPERFDQANWSSVKCSDGCNLRLGTTNVSRIPPSVWTPVKEGPIESANC